MKSYLSIFLVIISLILLSSDCEDEIKFEKPQPDKTEDLAEFVETLRGEYLYVDRNFDNENNIWEYFDIPELMLTLSKDLKISVGFLDSTTITISENSIRIMENYFIVFRKELIGDLIAKFYHADKFNVFRSILSNELNQIYFPKLDTMIVLDNTISFLENADTTEFHILQHAIHILLNRDTLGTVSFNPDNINGYYGSGDTISEFLLTDSTLKIIVEGDHFVEGSITDSTIHLYDPYDTSSMIISFFNDAMCIYWEGDTLIFPVIDNLICIEVPGGSPWMFKISDRNVLRKYRNSYYLNKSRNIKSGTYWSVSQLTLDDNILSFSDPNEGSNFDKLNRIMKVPEDSIKSHIVDPSRREFKKFIKSGGFSRTSRFVKLK